MLFEIKTKQLKSNKKPPPQNPKKFWNSELKKFYAAVKG